VVVVTSILRVPLGEKVHAIKTITSRAITIAAVTMILAGGVAMPSLAQDRDRDMDQMRDRLMDCSGPACVPDRDRQMDQLRQRLQDCSSDCDQYRERLRLQEQLRECDAAGRECPEVRAREREHWRMHGNGPGRGGQGQGGQGQGGNRGG
jgi:hypothetical protein